LACAASTAASYRTTWSLRSYEEHLPMRCLPEGDAARAAGGLGAVPARGDTLLLCPRHICPTVNLAKEALLLNEGQPHRWVPVEGRAH
jgi:hypothetical protein